MRQKGQVMQEIKDGKEGDANERWKIVTTEQTYSTKPMEMEWEEVQKDYRKLNDLDIGEDDAHNDECYFCDAVGEVVCCDGCEKVFHQSCMEEKISNMQENWLCQFCTKRMRNQCGYCHAIIVKTKKDLQKEEPPSYESQNSPIPSFLTCTLCFCQFHSTCIDIPHQLLHSERYFFSPIQNFVCNLCFRKYSVRSVLSNVRYPSEPQGSFYFFVRVNAPSPIHCTWVSERTLASVSQAKKQLWNEEALSFSDKIQKVIQFKAPFILRRLTMQQQIQQIKSRLKNGRVREKGSMTNFRFLVKWEGKSYNQLVWEDQSIFMFSHTYPLLKCLALKKYEMLIRKNEKVSLLELMEKQLQEVSASYRNILENQFDLRMANPKLFMELHSSQRKKFIEDRPKRLELLHSQCKNWTNRKPIENQVQIVTKESNDEFSVKDAIATLLKPIFSKHQKQIQGAPIVAIITKPEQMKGWREKIQYHLPQLTILTLKVIEELGNAFERDFFLESQFCTKFQILLISYQIYWKQFKNIHHQLTKFFQSSKQSNLRALIFDSSTEAEIKKLSLSLCEVKRIIITQKREEIKGNIVLKFPLYLKMFKYFSHFACDIFKKDSVSANRNSIENKQAQTSNSKLKRLFSRKSQLNIWPQSKRITLHIYILHYGLIKIQSGENLLDELKKQEKQIFCNEKQSDCFQYLKLYLCLVEDWQKSEFFQSNHDSYFLFGANRQQIYKRICLLGRLNHMIKTFEKGSKLPWKSPIKIFVEKKVVQVREWTYEYDLILCELIIQYGFGNWNAILNAKNWAKEHFETDLIQSSKDRNLVYCDFLLLFFKQYTKSKKFDLAAIIGERSKYFLESLS